MPVREGSEEYLDSEKYEARERALDGPLLPMIRRVNEIRHENPALQELSNVYFLDTHNDALIAYAKRSPGNCIITVVNLDPHNAQEGVTVIPAQLGMPPVFAVEDLLTGDHFDWRIGANYVRLDPAGSQAHIFESSRESQRSRPLVRGRAAVVQDGRALSSWDGRAGERSREVLREFYGASSSG